MPSVVATVPATFPRAAIASLRTHWPEYLIEGWALGMFMVSAGVFAVLLEAPGSWLYQAVGDPTTRRILGGIAMGLTAVAIIYSPWGQRSGAHMNPVVTLTFMRLGKVRAVDAFFYIVAQFVGGALGVLLVWGLLGAPFADPPVNFAATVPGPRGPFIALIAEVFISFGLMLTILTVSNRPKLQRFTGLFAGVLVATYISVEAPLSGMSMNPARTFASALPGGEWTGTWLYFIAPALGMFGAAALYRRAASRLSCAKLVHSAHQRCIHCGYRI